MKEQIFEELSDQQCETVVGGAGNFNHGPIEAFEQPWFGGLQNGDPSNGLLGLGFAPTPVASALDNGGQLVLVPRR